jgi:hypothetical protein
VCACALHSELLRGPLIYVAAMIFATIVFWRNSPVGIVGIALMCGGDGACAFTLSFFARRSARAACAAL